MPPCQKVRLSVSPSAAGTSAYKITGRVHLAYECRIHFVMLMTSGCSILFVQQVAAGC